MKVFKFGGASVKDAQGVRNLAQILKEYKGENPFVVISAMGKTTNALEQIARSFYLKKDNTLNLLKVVKLFHQTVLEELFVDNHSVFDAVSNLFVELEWALEDEPRPDYTYEYDQIVSIGELISTTIVSAYLKEVELDNIWLDARDFIKTDNKHKAANVDWELTSQLIRKHVTKNKLIITQGFIGCTSKNFTTTLGRDGSDYSAAIFATILKAKKLVIWKDVPGFLNADPRYFPSPKIISKLPFQEAIELAFYGASVIHPKTLQPLKKNSIPLELRSFLDPSDVGTWISDSPGIEPETPFYILKKNQTLLSISLNDLDFIVENNLSQIFSTLSSYNVKVNLLQNTAVSCSFAIDVDDLLFDSLIADLSICYKVKYNTGLELLTIRHYKDDQIQNLINNKTILLSQKNRTTIQVLLKS